MLLWGAVVATVAYLASLMLWLLPATKQCDTGDGLIERYLSCLEPNQLGDFLAGAFAPVAFLWLVAAVFIQSKELAAQREELKATRQEVADNRVGMEKQARQAQRQADYIEEQTANLNRAEIERLEERHDKVFAEALSAFRREHLSHLTQRKSVIGTTTEEISHRFPDFNVNDDEWALLALMGSLSKLENALAKPPAGKRETHLDAIASIEAPLVYLTGLEAKLSPAFQTRAASLKLSQTLDLVRRIVGRERGDDIIDR